MSFQPTRWMFLKWLSWAFVAWLSHAHRFWVPIEHRQNIDFMYTYAVHILIMVLSTCDTNIDLFCNSNDECKNVYSDHIDFHRYLCLQKFLSCPFIWECILRIRINCRRKFWPFDFERFPYPLKIFHCKHDKSIKFYVQSIEIIYAWDDGYMHQLLWILTSECNNFMMMPKHKSMLLTLRFTFMLMFKHLWRQFHLN